MLPERPAERSLRLQPVALLAALLMMLSVTVGVVLSSPAPVQAMAGDDVTVDVGQEVAFDASGSTGAAPLQFLWFFGNGDAELGGLPSFSAERETTFAYSKEGVYEAILIVTDGLGRVDVDSRVVTVRNVLPMAVVVVDALAAGAVVEVPEDTPVRFDGSGSEDTEGLLHDWDFGDGEGGAGAVVEHAYARRGTYVARLEVMDPKGAKDRAAVVVRVRNVAPEAGASFPSEAAEDELLTFDASATVDTPSDLAKLTYLWDLGDGTVEMGRLVEHAYGLSGAYRIRLQVIDDNGASSHVEGSLTIRNEPPVAVFPPFVVVEEDATVFFDASASTDTPSDMPVLTYSWDFDLDGKADAFGRRATHVFDDEGDCFVRLVVRDDDGASAVALTLVRVLDGEEDDPEVEDEDEEECEVDHEDEEDEEEDEEVVIVLEDEVVTFEAEDEDDDEDEETFRWIFRDGTEATGRVVQHAFAQAGTYHVLLVITDDEGEVEIEEFEVRVRNVPPQAQIAPLDSTVEDALLPFDGRGTMDTPSDVPTLQYRWTFGDGSVGVGPVVSHAYPTAGRYVVTLVVQDDNGALSETLAEISVNNVAPVASFEGPSAVFAEEPAVFRSTSEDTFSDEAALAIAWTLGDGTTAAGRELLHTFLAPGTYTVQLTITDDDGEVGLIAGTVEVKNRPPIAHIPFDLFMVYGEEGRASFRGLGFNGLSDQGSLSFVWDFGDGSSVTGRDVVHSYAASGTFIATLTVTDQHGAVGTDTTVVSVILDADLDGLPDLYETEVAGTDPQNEDTDGDGLLDSFELLVFETEPLLQDTDFDAWTDFEEVFAVRGYVTEPLDADSDDDGLPDGSELYTQAFKTTQRFAIPEQGSATVALAGVATGAPDFAIETADARLGLVHPRPGDLDVTLNRNGDGRSSSVEVAFPDAPNLFVSVDLLAAGFIRDELTNLATWTLEIANAGDGGRVEYFEIHIAARTSPIALDSDGDGLNDTEETNPGDDGWITDPWRADTDGDLISDVLEVQGWKKTESAVEGDPEGFRTDPTRRDTDRDGVRDRNDLDPLHDVMVQITLGDYFALDNDPDLDDVFPEPFVEVEFRGKSFYTPHPYSLFLNPGPAGFFLDLDKVYTLDVPDFTLSVTFAFRAWDDDLIAGNDKQWDLDRTSTGLDHFETLDLRVGSTGDKVALGEGDGDTSLDAELFYRIDTVRPARIPTILVDSLDTDDLLETASGDLRYLGDDVFYVAWLNVTSSSGPFVEGLNAILVPRAQFFNSSLNQTLQTTEDSGDLPAHLKDLAFTAFDASAAETTEAIAGVLNGTLSGAQAQLLLQELLRGPDGSTNGAFTVVTDQLVTLGLPDRIVNALPLAGIRFDEATGVGPGTFLSDFLDFILDAAAFVAQGLALIGTAIAAFFAEAVAFLGELGLAVIGAIGVFLGQVAEALESVAETLGAFLNFLLKFAVAVVQNLVAPILAELVATIEAYLLGVLDAFKLAIVELEETGDLSSATIRVLDGALSGTVFLILLTLMAGITVITTVLVPFSFTFGFILSFAISLAVLLIIGQLFQIEELQVSPNPGFALGMSLEEIVSFSRSLVEGGGQLSSPSSPQAPNSDQQPDTDLVWTVLSLFFGTSGLLYSGAAIIAQRLKLGLGTAFSIVFGILSVAFGFAALSAVLTPSAFDDFIMGVIGIVTGAIAIVISLTGFVAFTKPEAKAFGATGITLGVTGLGLGLVALT